MNNDAVLPQPTAEAGAADNTSEPADHSQDTAEATAERTGHTNVDQHLPVAPTSEMGHPQHANGDPMGRPSQGQGACTATP